MRKPEQPNPLVKELKQLHSYEPSSPVKLPPSDISAFAGTELSSEEIVDIWLRNYHLKTDAENCFYENFIECYLSWRDFSVPTMKDLQSEGRSRSRRGINSDSALSEVWEKCLVVHRPQMEVLSKQAEVAKLSYEKRLELLPEGLVKEEEVADVSDGNTVEEQELEEAEELSDSTTVAEMEPV